MLLPMLDVVVPSGGRLNAEQLHVSLRPTASVQRLLLDLRNAAWVEPIGLVMLAAMAERHVSRVAGGTVIFEAPRARSVARYLARMRLGSVPDNLGQEHDLPAVREWDAGHELVELRRFFGESEPEELAEMLFAKTETEIAVARALHQSVAELGVNVPQHSGLEYGYVAAQTTYGGTVVQFAVGDGGRGVAAGFDPAPNDARAIEQVLAGRSRKPDPGRGRGLPKTQKLVLGLGGSLHMLSGTAYRTHDLYGATFGGAPTTRRYPGTLLQGTFPVP